MINVWDYYFVSSYLANLNSDTGESSFYLGPNRKVKNHVLYGCNDKDCLNDDRFKNNHIDLFTNESRVDDIVSAMFFR